MLKSSAQISIPPQGSIAIWRNSDGHIYYKNPNGSIVLAEYFHDVYRIQNPKFLNVLNYTDENILVLKNNSQEYLFKITSLQSVIATGTSGGRGRRGLQGLQGIPGMPGATGPQGPVGPSGPSNLFANALFVDAQFGNDINAVPFSLIDNVDNPSSHKYQTITGVNGALANANPGDVIIVYPNSSVGSPVYTEGNLWKNGVTYYLYAGVTIIGYFEKTDSIAPETCKVFGYGTIIAPTDVPKDIINIPNNTLYIDCYRLQQDSFDKAIIFQSAVADSTTNIEAFANQIRSIGRGIYVPSTTSDFGLINVTVRELMECDEAVLKYVGIAQGFYNIKLTSRKIIGNGIENLPDLNIIETDASTLGGSTGIQIVINCIDIVDNSTNSGTPSNSTIYYRAKGHNKDENTLIINGNIRVTQSGRNVIYSTGSDFERLNRLEINGNVISRGSIMILDDSLNPQNGNYSLNGIATKSVEADIGFPPFSQNLNFIGANADGAIIINQINGDSTPTINIDGSIKNTLSGGNGIRIFSGAVPIIVFRDVKILTQLGVGNAINSDDPFTYKVTHSLARQTANINSTNSIVGKFGAINYNTLLLAFTNGEQIVGSVSGSTASIVADAPDLTIATEGSMVISKMAGGPPYNGAFVVGETITGAISGATAIVVDFASTDGSDDYQNINLQ